MVGGAAGSLRTSGQGSPDPSTQNSLPFGSLASTIVCSHSRLIGLVHGTILTLVGPSSSETIQIALGIAEVLEMLLEDDPDAVVHGSCAVLENRHLDRQCCRFDVHEVVT